MGLDSVELIMRAEEEFDLEIFDEEAELVSPLGQADELSIAPERVARRRLFP